jgi:hypothetical protein
MRTTLRVGLLIAVVVCAGTAHAGGVLFDNGNHVNTGSSSYTQSPGPPGSHNADNFVLPNTSTITEVDWKGFGGTRYPNDDYTDSFVIRIYADNGANGPTSPVVSSAIYTAPVTPSRQLTGEVVDEFFGLVYSYSAAIPDFAAIGGIRYWLEIYNDVHENAAWFWSADLDVAGGDHVYAFPNADWTEDVNRVEMTFQLIGTVPEPNTFVLTILGSCVLAMFGRHARCLIALVLVLASWAATAHAQIFVGDITGNGPQDLHGSIHKYNLDGSIVNPTFAPGTAADIQIAGSTMYVMNRGGEFNSTLSKFTTDGVGIPFADIPPYYIMSSLAVSSTNLYIAYGGGVGKFSLDGTTVNDEFITGLNSFSEGLAFSPDQSKLFISDLESHNVGVYDPTTGAAINSTLITGLEIPTALAIDGQYLYVVDNGPGTIGKYNLDGTVVNAALVTGLSGGFRTGHIAILGNSLFVADSGKGVVGEYDATTGATINAALISGLSYPVGLAVVPEPSSALLAFGGMLGLLGLVLRTRKS